MLSHDVCTTLMVLLGSVAPLPLFVRANPMRRHVGSFAVLAACGLLLSGAADRPVSTAANVPMMLDHNRMLVDADIQRNDGTWRRARLWVDTGSPDLMLSEPLARDLGIELPAGEPPANARAYRPEVARPRAIRIGGLDLDLSTAGVKVIVQPRWLFGTMHNDANLPSTVLKHYQVVFDYPGHRLILAPPGSRPPRGTRVPASVHPVTGIVQVDAVVAGQRLSLALDNGASYSFVSAEVLEWLVKQHSQWPRHSGAVGCANIWGWWPGEATWPMARVPDMQLGAVSLAGVGIVGLPGVFPGGLAAWYSQKTARPVAGFLGPNAFKAFRLEIDYANGAVYFERGNAPEPHDMDLVGLTLQPDPDGRYRVVGVPETGGRPAVDGIEPGDTLVKVGTIDVTETTMGTVVDALRGAPGEIRTLEIERQGRRLRIVAKVVRFM